MNLMEEEEVRATWSTDPTETNFGRETEAWRMQIRKHDKPQQEHQQYTYAHTDIH